MTREQMIAKLVAHNHLSCCDCDTYHRLMERQDETGLKRWYIIEFGAWSLEMEQRLRAGEVEALFAELMREGATQEETLEVRGPWEKEWEPIATAPKDGRAVLLLSAPDELEGVVRPAKCHIGHWDAEGTSWVDEHGELGGDCYTLAQTGFWSVGTGWFQPNEVTHWAALLLPPVA